MNIRLRSLRLVRRVCHTRLPFRFGIATMTEAPLLFARVEVSTDAGDATGDSAELLVPKWFAKNPNTTHDEDRADLEVSTRRTFECMRDAGDQTVFAHWLHAQRTLVETNQAGVETGPAGSALGDPLVAMFGVALVEKALIDAVCRATGQSVFAALTSDALGIEFGAIEDRLAGWSPADLGARTLEARVRHTVGLVDDLDSTDLAPDADHSDGHPLTLAEDIDAYGLNCFKLKVSGDADADIQRLERVGAITPAASTFTLDGNEQYGDPAALADVLDTLEARGNASDLVRNIISIEQPVSRKTTFDPATAPGIARLAERAPVIIDEADAALDSYPNAKVLGYEGVSMKACKGVFRALLNRARIDADGTGFQSAEDLTNLPTLPLLQDLSMVSLLGLPHVERNGHHYFRGSDHLTAAERTFLVEHHADLFDRDGRLRITNGRISFESLDTAGFGYSGPVALD